MSDRSFVSAKMYMYLYMDDTRTMNSRPLLTSPLAVIIVTLLLAASVDAGRILLMPAMQVSHVTEHQALGEALAGRGHQVYILLDSLYPHMGDITLAGVVPVTYTEPDDVTTFLAYNRDLPKLLWTDDYTPTTQIALMKDIHRGLCWRLLSNKPLMAKLKQLQLDFVMVDGFLFSPCLYLIPHNLTVPYGYMNAFVVDLAMGIPTLPSFRPNLFLGVAPLSMTFVDRVKNTLMGLGIANMLWSNDDREMRELYAPHAGSLADIVRQSSLVVVTCDHILDWPRAALPNTLYVPGITTQPGRPLPDTLSSLATASISGLILVSFGSSIDFLPVKLLQELMEGFRGVPDLTVIFRIKNRAVEAIGDSLPTNVHPFSWLPQQDILAHPNTKLFITHCGNNGQYEAVYHGVPMIGFPLFGDQFHNCLRMDKRGVGVCMDIKKFTSQELANNIKNVTQTVDFQLHSRKISAILKDDILPREIVTNKIEHILKHGYDHMLSPTLSMHFTQFVMLDILALFLVFLLICLCLLYLCLSACIKRMHNLLYLKLKRE